MTRVVNCRTEAYDIYVGRPKTNSHTGHRHFGNPFSHLASSIAEVRVGTREESIACFKDWLDGRAHRDVAQKQRLWILENLWRLRGKRLGCWCAPLNCHGDVYVEMVNTIRAYTDGAIRGYGKSECRTGHGVVLLNRGTICTISACSEGGTSNAAELRAIQLAFDQIKKRLPLTLHSDSEYAIGAIENDHWRVKANRELIEGLRRVYVTYCKSAKVVLKHVKGHNGNLYNELADCLAGQGLDLEPGQIKIEYHALKDYEMPDKVMNAVVKNLLKEKASA